MDISKPRAKALCKLIIKYLEAWPALDAALQEGGFEQKAASRVELAVERWIGALEKRGKTADDEKLLVLRDVKVPGTHEDPHRDRMDLVLVKKDSVGKALLKIDTLFEIKTNYAHQKNSWIQYTLKPKGKKSAFEQVKKYKRIFSGFDATRNWEPGAYLLYLITALPSTVIPHERPRSPGWANGNTPLSAGKTALSAALKGATPLGTAEDKNARVYCALIKA